MQLIPPHLQNANMEQAPIKVVEFAREYEAEDVYLVDDLVKCTNSVRLGKVIYINTRCTYWANMIPPPFWCHTSCEAIVLRFLHELGHINYDHPSELGLISTPFGLTTPRNQDIFTQSFSGKEGEAWEYALRIRKENSTRFSKLYQSYKNWYDKHSFISKDWDDDDTTQWKRLYGNDLSQERFQLPQWVVDRFGKYKPE